MTKLTLTPIGLQAINYFKERQEAIKFSSVVLDAEAAPFPEVDFPTPEAVVDVLPPEALSFYRRISTDSLNCAVNIPNDERSYAFGRFIIYFQFFGEGQEYPLGWLSFSKKLFKRYGAGHSMYFDLDAPDIARVINFDPLIDLRRQLTDELRNGIYGDIFDSASIVLDKYVQQPRRELARIREVERLPLRLAIDHIRQLGINFFSNVLTQEDIERLAAFVSLYYPEGNTRAFDKFLSYFINVRLDLVQLWNTGIDQWEEFRPVPGTKLWEGGAWYPTSHLDIYYDFEQNGQIDVNFLKELFYKLAPIHLVLNRIVSAFYGNTTLHLVAAGHVVERHTSYYDFGNAIAIRTPCNSSN